MDTVTILGADQLAAWGRIRPAYDHVRYLAAARLQGLLDAKEADYQALAAGTRMDAGLVRQQFGPDVENGYSGRIAEAELDLAAADQVWAEAEQALAAWAATGQRPGTFSVTTTLARLGTIRAKYDQLLALGSWAGPRPDVTPGTGPPATLDQVRAGTAGLLARLGGGYR